MESNKFGERLSSEVTRDAVHVAICPILVAHDMEPGTKVGVCDGFAATYHNPICGIIDPFIPDTIKAGERVWLLMKPGSVEKLRHTWEHQALPGPQVYKPKELTVAEKRKIVDEYCEENDLQLLNAEIDTSCAECW